MLKQFLPAVIVAAILAAIGGVFHVRDSRALAEARGATTVAVAEAHLAVQWMNETVVWAQGQKAVADRASQAAALEAERAKRLAVRPALPVLPVVCKPALEALARADSASASWQAAYAGEHAATGTLRAALDSVQRVGTTLAAITTRVNDAATALVKASRPSFFARLKPDIGFGAAIGVDPFTRKPSTTIGVTLSWDF